MGASNKYLLYLWLCFVTHGAICIMILPPWEGFDEWLHYSYTAYLAREKRIPVRGINSIPAEILESLKLLPHPPTEPSSQSPYKLFWAEEASALSIIQKHKNIKNDFGSNYVQANWQSQHPPLYHLLIVPFYLRLEGIDLTISVLVLRIISLLIASLAIIPILRIFKFYFTENESVLMCLILIVFPATFILFGHITNDCLSFPLMGWLTLLFLQEFKMGPTRNRAIGCGILAGLGAVTKLYFLTTIVAISILYVLKALLCPSDRKQYFLSLFFFSFTWVLLFTPWVLYSYFHYGTWNTTHEYVLSAGIPVIAKIQILSHVRWWDFFQSIIGGMLWAGNWSFVTFPNFIYRIFKIALFILVARFIWQFSKNAFKPIEIWVPALFILLFILGLAHHQWMMDTIGIKKFEPGWYLTVLLPHKLILAALSFKAFPEKRFWKFLTLIFSLTYFLSLWGNFGLLLPYYAGFFVKDEIQDGIPSLSHLFDSIKRVSSMNNLPEWLLPVFFLGELMTIFFLLRTIQMSKRKIQESI